MSLERIDRYKKTPVLKFQEADSELAFQQYQDKRGRSTGVYALSALTGLNLVFAFLEHWILGLKSMLPLMGYLIVALLCLASIAYSLVSSSTKMLKLRTLLPALLTFATLLAGVYFEQYRIYHTIEMVLLLVWIGSLNILSMRAATALAILMIVPFSAIAYVTDDSQIKFTALMAAQLGALIMAMTLSYLMERFRRILFLTGVELQDVYNRQESWAFTLIDLDLALSGIRDFKEMTSRLIEYIKQVVAYDSFVFTSLEGKGPKPEPDQVEGALFEDEDATLWSDDLMTKLAQTRHAVASAQFDESKGWFGQKKTNFQHFRLDVPIFNDSNLVGVVSLRRQSRPYDDLDKTASVSMAAQAMMIFKRTEKSSQMSEELMKTLAQQKAAAAAAAAAPVAAPVPASAPVKPTLKEVVAPKSVPSTQPTGPSGQAVGETTDTSAGMEITNNTTTETQTEIPAPKTDNDEAVISPAMLQKIKQDTETARKTITLLSRENADQLAKDKYRMAAVESEALSVLLIEVDGLSSIRENDGDQAAYKVFAGIVKYVFSKSDKEKDVLGRYGQNGLSVLLPKVDMNAAEKFAESMRQYVESVSFKTAYGERKATLSIGVAAITDDTGNYESMVKRADMALFVAKKNGRNCVKVRL